MNLSKRNCVWPKVFCLWGIVFLLTFCQVNGIQGAESFKELDEATRLFEKIYEHRKSIQNAHFKIKGTSTDYEHPFVWDIAFEGDRIRCDKTSGDRTFSNCVSCFWPSVHLTFDSKPLPNTVSPLYVNEIGQSPHLLPHDARIPDTRYIGIHPCSLYQQALILKTFFDIHSTLSGGLSSISITETDLEKDPCWKLAWQQKIIDIPADPNSGRIVTGAYYFSRNHEDNIRRVEISDSKGWKNRLDVQLQRHKKSGFWFPAHCFHQEHDRRKNKVEQEEYDIEILKLNEPLDPRLFTLADSTTLPVGTPVIWEARMDPPGQGPLTWTGDSIATGYHGDPRSGVMSAEIGLPPTVKRPWGIVILGNLALISAFAIFHILRIRQRRMTK